MSTYSTKELEKKVNELKKTAAERRHSSSSGAKATNETEIKVAISELKRRAKIKGYKLIVP